LGATNKLIPGPGENTAASRYPLSSRTNASGMAITDRGISTLTIGEKEKPAAKEKFLYWHQVLWRCLSLVMDSIYFILFLRNANQNNNFYLYYNHELFCWKALSQKG
jgi:hypothetical protein